MTRPAVRPGPGGTAAAHSVDERAARSVRPAGGRAASALATAPLSLLTFVLVAGGLLLRNRSLFTVPLYEVGDAAVNSLLVNDAKSLDLLVGHYSRVGFNHPGPGVLYVQAFGDAVFTDLLGLTPAAYNGQVLAVLLLNAGIVAAVVAVLQSWCRRRSVALVALATVAVWYAGHTYSLSSTWIPLVVVVPFLLLLVSSASVAAGRTRHLPLLAACGGLLVHAHVEFALFVPVLVLAALLTLAVTERLSPRRLLARGGRPLAVAAGIVALFALPIVLNTLVNWPGEVPKYLSYSKGQQSGAAPTLAEALHYARQFWAPQSSVARYVPPLLVLGALAACAAAPRPARRPLLALTGACLLAEALFVVYALVGIDDLGQDYVGLFSWSVPLGLLLVIAAALAARAAQLPAGRLLLGAGALAAAVVALSEGGFTLRSEGRADLPAAVQQLEQATGRGPVVLDVGSGTGPFYTGTGLLLQLERAGTPVCILNEELRIQVTSQRTCTTGEAADGRRVELREPGSAAAPTFRTLLSDVTVLP